MLPEKLRLLRDLKALSLRDLEKISGISNVMLSRYETGKTKPSPKMLKKLAIALDTPYEELLDELYDTHPDQSFNDPNFKAKLIKAMQLKEREKHALSIIMDAFFKNLEIERLAKK